MKALKSFFGWLLFWLIVKPLWYVHGLWFDLSIWYHNADWLHPIRSSKKNSWQTVKEGNLYHVEPLIGRVGGSAFLALELTFEDGTTLLIDEYAPPTASVPKELEPGNWAVIRRNGLGEYRFY